jgi:hypothetical protein
VKINVGVIVESRDGFAFNSVPGHLLGSRELHAGKIRRVAEFDASAWKQEVSRSHRAITGTPLPPAPGTGLRARIVGLRDLK